MLVIMNGLANVLQAFVPLRGGSFFTLPEYRIAIFMAIAKDQSTARRALREQIRRAYLVILLINITGGEKQWQPMIW
jgi:hypothetical protein